MQELEIKSMGLRHLPQIIKIEEESFNSPWSVAAFIKELYNNYANYWVGLAEDQVVGYLGIWLLKNEVHITNLAVKKDYRCRGIATRLLNFLYSKVKGYEINKISLEVRVSNKKARKLYYDEGFVKVKIKKNYYKDNGEDAVVMWKQL